MTRPDSGNAPAPQFTETDREVAQRAWDVYMDAINGTGLRWEFDGQPNRMEYVLGRTAMHRREIDRFVDKLRVFGGFVADLATFKDRPITHPHPFGWSDEFPDTITRTVTDTAIKTYTTMHNTAVDYAGALLQHGPDSAEALQAATAVAQTVDPESWSKAGHDVPDITPYSRLATRWYLEAVITQPEAGES